MVLLLILGILAVAAAAAGLVALTRDGYGAVPTRPGTPPAERTRTEREPVPLLTRIR